MVKEETSLQGLELLFVLLNQVNNKMLVEEEVKVIEDVEEEEVLEEEEEVREYEVQDKDLLFEDIRDQQLRRRLLESDLSCNS